jgi:hypothetical protein
MRFSSSVSLLSALSRAVISALARVFDAPWTRQASPIAETATARRNALFPPHIGFCLGRTVIAEPK